MIIKSHVISGYRAAAAYLKEQGKNESIRLVKISDPDAVTLDQAFWNMWVIASNSQIQKPLHHISINPMPDERLSDTELTSIVRRCEQKYGYLLNDHQHVIVEHILGGRQHFHVIWCRVSLTSGKSVWPGEHWKKSKQAAREMEREIGLKHPIPRFVLRQQEQMAQKDFPDQPILAPHTSSVTEPNEGSENHDWLQAVIHDWES